MSSFKFLDSQSHFTVVCVSSGGTGGFLLQASSLLDDYHGSSYLFCDIIQKQWLKEKTIYFAYLW